MIRRPSSPPVVSQPAPFIDAAAAEAWDAWFRWREGSELRDVTVESSLRRVATALSAVEPQEPERWCNRFLAAFNDWKLVLDAQILASAGTGHSHWARNGLSAVLNAAAFVRSGFTPDAQFDLVEFEHCAELAVRALDNALWVESVVGSGNTLRIGVVGVADALAMLGLVYDSDAARSRAQSIMTMLATGCLRGSLQLACERGPLTGTAPLQSESAQRRALPPTLVEALQMHGMRHAALTAIERQPQLALLANNVADALDPLGSGAHCWHIEAPDGARRVRSAGYASTLYRRMHPIAALDTPLLLATPPVEAQIAMRAACAPFVDAALDYPLCTCSAPDLSTLAHWSALAATQGLPPTPWRQVDPEG